MTTQEYEEIAHRMRPQLIQLGRSFFHDEEPAADAVQEAMLRLWLLREKVNNTSHAEALLVRMTKNICVSEWRRRCREPACQTPNQTAAEADKLIPYDEEVLMSVEDNENLRHLQSAISTLPPQEQRLFRMRHELGMDVSQIAAATGLLPRSVSTMVCTARRKIVELLKKRGIL